MVANDKINTIDNQPELIQPVEAEKSHLIPNEKKTIPMIVHLIPMIIHLDKIRYLFQKDHITSPQRAKFGLRS